MQIGNRIKDIRQKYNLTQEKLASDLAVSRQAVSKWESGQAIPDAENLMYISDLYDVSLDELIKGDERVVQKIAADSGAKKWHLLGVVFFVALVGYIIVFGLQQDIWMVGLGISALFMLGIDLWLLYRNKPLQSKLRKS